MDDDGDEIEGAQRAGTDALVLAFGHLQAAASRLELVLGREIEHTHRITRAMFEVLLLLGRAGVRGLSMREIGAERVLTTGGVTRLIDRMEAAGPVERSVDPQDRRGRTVRLTHLGEQTTVEAARTQVENLRRHFLDPLPEPHREQFVRDLRLLSISSRRALPRLP
jgi:DNA-binding MarR family transcriptional regulator